MRGFSELITGTKTSAVGRPAIRLHGHAEARTPDSAVVHSRHRPSGWFRPLSGFGSVAARILSLLLWLAGHGVAFAAEPKSPNIVLLVAEGLGDMDAAHGATPDVPTPQLDAMAASGVRLVQAYAASPSLEAERIAIATGQHPVRLAAAPKDGHSSTSTIEGVLGALGYLTASFPEAALSYASQTNTNAFVPPPIRVVSREAGGFIDRQRDKPFFLQVTWRLAENPSQADTARLMRFEHLGDLRRRHRAAGWADVDEGVGRILNRLRAHGIENDTLVFS